MANGSLSAIAWSGRLSVFDTATGRSIAQHGSAHASPISAIAFSGDGAKLATADAEGTIKIWADAQKLNSKSAALLTLKGHRGAINSVEFSIDGKRLVSTSADKTARVWDLENAGAAIRPLERSGPSLVARFSPDGQLIAAAAGSSLRLWDAATGRLVRELSAGDKGRISQRGILADRQPPAGCGVRRTGRRFSCRAVGHRCRNGTSAVAGSDRSARLLGGTMTPERSVRWRFRPMGNTWSQVSAQGVGLRHQQCIPIR